MNNPLKLDNIYEMLYVPKAFVLVSRVPAFEFQKQFLKIVYDNLFIPRLTGVREQRDRLEQIPQSLLTMDPASIDHLEMSKSFDDEAVNIDSENHLEFLLSTVLEVFRLRAKSERISLVRPKFTCETVPVLAKDRKGSVKRLTITAQEELLSYVVPVRIIFYIPNFAFKILFQKLNLINVVRLFTNILLERQIIIFAENPAQATILCECLLYLMTPLTWSCIYIPFLPIELWETLHAMMPFIIGIPKKYRKFIESQIDITDKVIVDLDENEIRGGNVRNSLNYALFLCRT